MSDQDVNQQYNRDPDKTLRCRLKVDQSNEQPRHFCLLMFPAPWSLTANATADLSFPRDVLDSKRDVTGACSQTEPRLSGRKPHGDH